MVEKSLVNEPSRVTLHRIYNKENQKEQFTPIIENKVAYTYIHHNKGSHLGIPVKINPIDEYK